MTTRPTPTITLPRGWAAAQRLQFRQAAALNTPGGRWSHLLDRCPPEHRAKVEQHIARMGARRPVPDVVAERLKFNWFDTSHRSRHRRDLRRMTDKNGTLKQVQAIDRTAICNKGRSLLQAAFEAAISGNIATARDTLISASASCPALRPLYNFTFAHCRDDRAITIAVGDLLGLDK